MSAEFRLIVSSSAAADLNYACRFRSGGDAVVFLKGRRRSWLVAPLMERERAVREVRSAGCEVLTPADLALEAGDRRRTGAWALGLLRRLRIGSVTVGADFPLGVADELRRNGLRLVVAADRLFPEREIKSPREQAYCREAQMAATAAMRAAADMIGAASWDAGGRLCLGGRRLTAELVRGRMEAVLLERGCGGADTIVACGAQSALPHHRGAGPLRAGCPIVIDVFPRHRRHGYHGDLTRTLVRGPAPPKLRGMFTAVRAARAAALARVRAGVAAASVHAAAVRAFESLGMATDYDAKPPRGFIHSTGHGIGLDVHEAPWIGTNRSRLRAGQVITIEPGWYEPGFGGVRIEDTVVVTRDGYAFLAKPCKPL